MLCVLCSFHISDLTHCRLSWLCSMGANQSDTAEAQEALTDVEVAAQVSLMNYA